jgi:7,8-dihydropterin-6-yl-methyl-4-(beta-D-ribofuranosyl)aminobenzene 5'-phosphate synthase
MFAADSVEILVLVENWVDMLLGDEHVDDGSLHCVTRNGLIAHFDPKNTPPVAENGLALLVTARSGAFATTILFDAGLTGTALEHNLRVLRRDPAEIDAVVISHGHPDHYGGINTFLDLLDRPVLVVTHHDAFLPRFAVMADGRTSPFYNSSFTVDALESRGGRTVITKEAVELGWGMFTTGVIPRESAFEGPRPPLSPRGPGLYQVNANGAFGLDEVWDEQGLVVDVADEGLIVLVGCSHAGVVNTVAQARALRPDRPVRANIGGFHLGFPTTPRENVDHTVNALRELEVRTIMPMHCSGLAAHRAFSTDLSDNYVQPSVGTVLRFGR